MTLPAAEGGKPLCRLIDIEDGEAKGITLGSGAEPLELLVVREGEAAYCYVNSCPHVGTPLEFNPDDFMSPDGGFLMCHTHGALFRIEDGHCVAGPCAGDRLTALPIRIEKDGALYLDGPAG